MGQRGFGPDINDLSALRGQDLASLDRLFPLRIPYIGLLGPKKRHADLIARLKTLLGEGGWSDDPARLAPKLVEWRDRWHGATPLLVLPRSTAEVAAVVSLCAEAGAAVTPQGGNTGLVGGQIPQGEILLSLEKMTAVRDIDGLDDVAVVEAGITLAAVHDLAEGAGRMFPLSLA